VARNQQAPQNPRKRRKENTPNNLQDPPMLEEDNGKCADKGEEDKDKGDEGKGKGGFAAHLEQQGNQGNADSMLEDD
jgi:hypothetical protein